jgi:hypothetical protein
MVQSLTQKLLVALSLVLLRSWLVVEQLSHGFKVLDSRGWLGLLCVSLCCNWLFLNRLGRLVGVYFDYFFLFCFISWSCC